MYGFHLDVDAELRNLQEQIEDLELRVSILEEDGCDVLELMKPTKVIN